MTRSVVLVDLETSALRPSSRVGMFGVPLRPPYGVVVEAAWWNLSTGEHGGFVPKHDVQAVRAHGSIEALTVCRYLERLAGADQDDGTEVARLHEQLRGDDPKGNALAGSNPAFDARFLRALFARTWPHGSVEPRPAIEPFHHRHLDVSAYAAGAWGLSGDQLPGLAAICARLAIAPPDHTAAGDVLAAGEALYRLGAVARPTGEGTTPPPIAEEAT